VSGVLVTVRGPRGAEDLLLPSDQPLEALLADLAERVGGLEAIRGSRMVRADGTVLDPAATLAEAGVEDGQVLSLVAGSGGRRAGVRGARPQLPAARSAPGAAPLPRRLYAVARALAAPGRTPLRTPQRGRRWSERLPAGQQEPRIRLSLRRRMRLAWIDTAAAQRVDDTVRACPAGPRCAVLAVATVSGEGDAGACEALARVLWLARGGDLCTAELDLHTGALVPGVVDTVGVRACASLPLAVDELGRLAGGADALVVGLRGALDAPAARELLAAADQAVLLVAAGRDQPDEVQAAVDLIAVAGGPEPVVVLLGDRSFPSRDTVASYARDLQGARGLQAGEAGGDESRPAWARELAACLVADWAALGVGRCASQEVAS
jgi:hypothetical protein